MKDRDSFSRCHPAVSFLYFALVIGFSMFLAHPACLVLSLVSALCYSVSLNGGGALRRQLAFVLPAGAVTALVNLLFNHRGATILAYLPDGNPLTLESALYALSAAGMLWAVVTWFSCYNAVMTSDKFLYLFGRVIPAVSLVLSMTLRFVPRFQYQLRAVAQARRRMGRGASEKGPGRRLQNAVAILSASLSWSLENAMDAADSMRSRGFGLPGRTAFSLYRLDRRDRAALLWLGGSGAFLLWGGLSGALSWRYFPSVKAAAITPLTVPLFAVYLALCLTPLILNGREALAWRRSSCAM